MSRHLILVALPILCILGCATYSQLYEQGHELWLNDEHEQAVARLTEAIRLDPKSAEALHLRGLAYYSLDKLDAADADFAAAFKIDGTKPPYESWGDKRLDAGEYVDAVENYTHALTLVPNDPNLRYKRGVAYFSLGREKEAAADFDSLGGGAAAYLKRAQALYEAEKYKEAAPFYMKAVTSDTKDGSLWFRRGLSR